MSMPHMPADYDQPFSQIAAQLSLLKKRIRNRIRDFEIPANPTHKKNKTVLAKDICRQIKLYIQIEQEMLFPYATNILGRQDELSYQRVEAAVLERLRRAIENMQPTDTIFDSTVSLLGDYMLRHIKQTEDLLLELQAPTAELSTQPFNPQPGTAEIENARPA